MTPQLKIRDLELVVALHEEGTFTQAAKRVGITEPAFSKRLKLVEREVKETLFDRNYDGVTTTDSGRSFVAHILESIHSYYRAVHEAHEAKHGQPPGPTHINEPHHCCPGKNGWSYRKALIT